MPGVYKRLSTVALGRKMKNTDGILFSMPRETESTREKSFRTSKTNSDTMKASRKYRSTPRRCIFRYGQDLWLHGCRQHRTWTRVTKKLELLGNSEIKNVFLADVASSLWGKPVLLKEQAIKWTKARVYVYSDSVLCMGKQHGPENAIRTCNDQVSTLKMCPTFSELQGLDGDPNDSVWKIFSGAKALYILHKIQADLQGKTSHLKKFSVRIIFMSMFNDIDLERKDNASKFKDGHWALLGPGEESK